MNNHDMTPYILIDYTNSLSYHHLIHFSYIHVSEYIRGICIRYPHFGISIEYLIQGEWNPSHDIEFIFIENIFMIHFGVVPILIAPLIFML